MPFLFQASGVSHIWYNDPITIATVVIAVCTIFYSLFTFLLLKATVQNTRITNAIFDAAHRPYIGIPSIEYNRDEEKRFVQFTAMIENSGAVPAGDLQVDIQVLLDSVPLQISTYENNGSYIMPRSTTKYLIKLMDDKFTKVERAAVLNLRFSIKYKGIAQKQYQ